MTNDEQVRAQERATSVLLSALTPEQRDTYQARGYFDLQVDDRHYRIHRNECSYNVWRLTESGRLLYRFCAVPNEYMPMEYIVLAQFLMLKTDEERFLRIANRAGH